MTSWAIEVHPCVDESTSHNTRLPAPFLASLVTSPNPWSVALFAEDANSAPALRVRPRR